MIARIILSILAAVSLSITLAAAAYAQPSAVAPNAQIVAEINGRKISKSELDEELRRNLKGELANFGEDEQHQLRKQMLQMMVRRRLLLDQARKTQLTPSEQEVSTFVAELKAAFGHPDVFRKHLKDQGLTEEQFTEGLREDLSIQHYLEQIVLKDVTVSDDMLKKAFEESPQSFGQPEEVKARHILLRVEMDAEEEKVEEVRTRAEAVLEKAKTEGTDFAALARDTSEASNKGKGGELDFFTKNQMDKDFSEAAFSLEPGAVSDLVRTKFGFHIIKVEQKRGGEVPKYEAVKEKVRVTVLRKEQERVLSEHVAALRKSNKVIIYYQ